MGQACGTWCPPVKGRDAIRVEAKVGVLMAEVQILGVGANNSRLFGPSESNQLVILSVHLGVFRFAFTRGFGTFSTTGACACGGRFVGFDYCYVQTSLPIN